MFRKMPVILALLISLLVIFDSIIPLALKSAIYALSLSVKSAIIFVLPFLIFMLLFKTISQLSKNATKVIIFILAAICISNFISTMISYEIGKSIYNLDISIAMPQESLGLAPSWNYALPKLIPNDLAMFAGLLLGILGSIFVPSRTNQLSQFFDKAVHYLLQVITWVMPVFVSGFVVKLLFDNVLGTIVFHYALIFCLVALSLVCYIVFLLMIYHML